MGKQENYEINEEIGILFDNLDSVDQALVINFAEYLKEKQGK